MKVYFDYDDGNTESVTLGFKSATVTPLLHEYIYNTYGIYYVRARVANNISDVNVTARLQVGENITFVDMYADVTKLSVGENVTFRVHW